MHRILSRLAARGAATAMAASMLLTGCPYAAAQSSLPAAARDGDTSDFTFAMTGDAIGPYDPVTSTHDGRITAVQKLLRSADGAFGNQEGAIFDVEDFTGYVGAENGGGTPLAPTSVARDLRALGITMMSKANNHAVDYGLEGLAASGRALTEAGIVFAGSGRDPAGAHAPAVVSTPHGRIALVATASTFPAMSPAGPASQRAGLALAPRPGLSVIRLRKTVIVRPEDMTALSRISVEGVDATSDVARSGAASPPSSELELFGQTFRTGPRPGLHYEPDKNDVAAVMTGLQAARSVADHVVFSIHAHETASEDSEDVRPADFLPSLFHHAIDAGADIVIRHGPHALRGIEIYKGRPIFYGMASLFMGVGDEKRMFRGEALPPSYDDGMIALVRFHKGRPSEVRLRPTETIREPGLLLGAPRLATAAKAREILARIQRLSEPYGTRIAIRDGIGIITLD